MMPSCSSAWPAVRWTPAGLEVGHVLSDIESLNRAAFEGRYEVTAMSFHAYAYLHDRYILLPHGASMGENYGPLVVVRQDAPASLAGVHRGRAGHADVGIPGAEALRPIGRDGRDAIRPDPGSRAAR